LRVWAYAAGRPLHFAVSALKIKATDTAKAIERTLAMAAGLTDHIWTVEELLAIKHI